MTTAFVSPSPCPRRFQPFTDTSLAQPAVYTRQIRSEVSALDYPAPCGVREGQTLILTGRDSSDDVAEVFRSGRFFGDLPASRASSSGPREQPAPKTGSW